MEVQLKKVKITNSILKQVQLASLTQMLSYDVLGYVIETIKGRKYSFILLYNANHNTLVKCIWPNKIEAREEWVQIDANGTGETQYNIFYSYTGSYKIYRNNGTKEHNESLCHKLQEMKQKAINTGQIYY